MSNMIRNESDALTMYRNGYIGFRREINLDAKTYYENLYELVIREYKTQGFCKLVNTIIDERFGVEAITYRSLEDALNILKGNDKKSYGKYAEMIGNRFVTWNDWQRYSQQTGTGKIFEYNEEIRKTLLELQMVGQSFHLSWLNNGKLSEEKQTEVITTDAVKKAEPILNNANAEAGKIISEAKAEAERIRLDVYRDIAMVKQSAESSNVFIDAIRTHLAQERDAMKEEFEREFAGTLNENRMALGKIEEIHNIMCEQSNKLQASWVKALDATVDGLAKIKEDLYKNIRSWQVSLYSHELRPLAERYVELYRIVNIDKIIAEELFQINGGEYSNEDNQYLKNNQLVKKQIEIKGSDDIQTKAVNELNSSPVLKALEKLNRTLTIFLRKFEMSLNGLDMYVYYPKQGEKFDDVWHVLEDDTDYDYSEDYSIEHCVLPGVAKKVNDDGEDDVIIPAIVSVEKR